MKDLSSQKFLGDAIEYDRQLPTVSR